MATPACPPATPQQFCVRWNSYQSNLQNAFPKLLTSEHFVDVTLACENEMLKCHKVVLSACSTYFEKLLLQNPCQHPIIFMKDMKFQEMLSLVDFMYKGEVNVTQDDLPSLLKSAEALQIRGLCGSDQLLNQQHFLKTQAIKPAPVPSATSVFNGNNESDSQDQQATTSKDLEEITKIEKPEEMENINTQSSSESDSNDGQGLIIKDDKDQREDLEGDESYYDGETDILETECMEEDLTFGNGPDDKTQIFSAMANVACHYDGTPGSATKRIRRSDEELRRAAECITRGQTFQTVSDKFNIPISTIRFYMARKGILPRRKRGRACSGPMMNMGGSSMQMPVSSINYQAQSGNTSPIGPPYHIVHYKLPALGVSKLK